MLFNSFEYIFLFLPVVLALFYFLRRYSDLSAQAVLVLASLFFYGYWNVSYLFLICGSVVANYLIAGRIEGSSSGARKRWLALGVGANLAAIGYYKYWAFFLENVAMLVEADWAIEQLILPLGISFFTFQQIAYLVDVYAGSAKEHNPIRYALFVTFFPQLIAGPIVHHSEMMPQFSNPGARRRIVENINVGLVIFSIGLFKKTVLADSVAQYSTPVFQASDAGLQVSFFDAWIGAFAYSFQLYFDFSGYSDMAIGGARMFGIRLPENFNSPYKATSIIDFWRRWHITLSRFLRDYLYIPLGGSRRGPYRRYMNVFVTMLLGGLWHGAGWTFVLWGALHGLCLLVNHAWRHFLGASRTVVSASWPVRLLGVAATFFCVLCGWVIFRSETLSGAENLLTTMFGMNGIALPKALAASPIGPLLESLGATWGGSFSGVVPVQSALLWIIGLMPLVWLMPNTQQIMRRYRPVIRGRQSALAAPGGVLALRALHWRPTPLWMVFTVTAFVTGASFILGWNSEFLYFQF